MKTSNKIILVTIILILLTTAAYIIRTAVCIIRLNPDSIKIGKESSEIISSDFFFKGIDSVSVDGLLEVEIVQADSYKTTITAPEYLMKHIRLDQSGNTLQLKQLYISGFSPAGIKARISMPRLSSINISFGSKVHFFDFKINKLIITASGVCKVNGSNSTIDNLNISVSGSVVSDLVSCKIINADIDLSGSAKIELNMAGGKLRGHASGTSQIIYRGTVSERDIEISGTAKIVKKD